MRIFCKKKFRVFSIFMRTGGNVILIHRFGGDMVQKTNLNELSSHFGFYFENSLSKGHQ